MKTAIIIKDSFEYISQLEEEDKLFILADSVSLNDLYNIAKSKSLTEKYILIFDLSIAKIKKPHEVIIKSTTHDVVVLADDEKKIPKAVLEICQKKIFDKVEKKSNPINTLNELGKEKISISAIKQFPLGYLIKYLNVNWDKFDNKRDVYDLLLEVNKRLYKVGDDFLYLYLAYNFPKQKRRTFFRYPSRKKFMDRDSIINKVSNYYGFSVKEVMKSWWLIKKVMNNEMADKFELTPAEKKLLYIKVDKVEKEDKIHRDLLEI